jgi:hypothetical protein
MNSLKQVDSAHIPNKTKHLLDAKSRTLAAPRLKDSFIVSVVLLARAIICVITVSELAQETEREMEASLF